METIRILEQAVLVILENNNDGKYGLTSGCRPLLLSYKVKKDIYLNDY